MTMSIKGNDIADGEANPSTTSTTEEVYIIAFARLTAQKSKDHHWINEWKKGGRSQAKSGHHELGLEATTKVKSMPEMTLKRYVLG